MLHAMTDMMIFISDRQTFPCPTCSRPASAATCLEAQPAPAAVQGRSAVCFSSWPNQDIHGSKAPTQLRPCFAIPNATLLKFPASSSTKSIHVTHKQPQFKCRCSPAVAVR